MTNAQVTEQAIGDGVCPDCEEEITVSATGLDLVELECRCGCSFAAA